MAPPERPFHVSELPQRVHARLDQMGQLKSRRLPQDFELKKDCELMELVQYSCTPWQESISMSLEGKRQECRPVVRFFRRCRQGEKVFHVETTAWEGEGAWMGKGSDDRSGNSEKSNGKTASTATSASSFADYGSHFWSMQS